MGNQRGRPMKARPRILQTARELFLRHGLDVSLDTIAAEAGTSRPTLYSHFPGGKDALLLETFAFLNDTMQPPLRQLLQERQQDFPALLRGFAKVVQAHFYAPENIHFQRLLIQVLVQKPELYVTLEQRPSGRVLQALSEILAQKKRRFADHQRSGARSNGVSRRDYGLSAAGGLNCAKSGGAGEAGTARGVRDYRLSQGLGLRAIIQVYAATFRPVAALILLSG